MASPARHSAKVFSSYPCSRNDFSHANQIVSPSNSRSEFHASGIDTGLFRLTPIFCNLIAVASVIVASYSRPDASLKLGINHSFGCFSGFVAASSHIAFALLASTVTNWCPAAFSDPKIRSVRHNSSSASAIFGMLFSIASQSARQTSTRPLSTAETTSRILTSAPHQEAVYAETGAFVLSYVGAIRTSTINASLIFS